MGGKINKIWKWYLGGIQPKIKSGGKSVSIGVGIIWTDVECPTYNCKQIKNSFNKVLSLRQWIKQILNIKFQIDPWI